MDARIMMGSGYPAAARALFARMTTPPTSARKSQITRLIRSLKKAGVWDKLDVLYVFAAANTQAALLNWKDATYNAVNSSATFAADRGYTGNASSAYLSTGYQIGSGQSSLSSLTIGRVLRTASSVFGSNDIGVQDGSNYAYAQSNGDSSQVFAANAGGDLSNNISAGGTGAANIACVRSGTTYSAFRNGLFMSSSTGTMGSIAYEFTLLAQNNAGTKQSFSNGQMSAAYIGGAMTPTQIAALHTALQTYLASVGA